MTRVSGRSRQTSRQRKIDSTDQSIAFLNNLSVYAEDSTTDRSDNEAVDMPVKTEHENQTMPGPFEGIPNSSDHEDDGWATQHPITRAVARVTRLDNIFEESVSPKVRKSSRLNRNHYQKEPASSPLRNLRSRTDHVDNELFVSAEPGPADDQVVLENREGQSVNSSANGITEGEPLSNVRDRDTNGTTDAKNEILKLPDTFRQQSAPDPITSSKKRKRPLAGDDERDGSFHPSTDDEETDTGAVDIEAEEVAEGHVDDEVEESEQEEMSNEDEEDAYDDDNDYSDGQDTEDAEPEQAPVVKDVFNGTSSNLRSNTTSLPVPRVEISPPISASHRQSRKKSTPRTVLPSRDETLPVTQDSDDAAEDRHMQSTGPHTEQLPEDTLFLEASEVMQLQRSWRDLMQKASKILPLYLFLDQFRFRAIDDIKQNISELNAIYKEMIQHRAAGRVDDTLVRASHERLHAISGKAFRILGKAQKRATSGTTPAETLKNLGQATALMEHYETDVIRQLVEAAKECLKAYYVPSSQSLALGGFSAVRDILDVINATCERVYSLKRTGIIYTKDACRHLRPTLRTLLEDMKYGELVQRQQAWTDRDPPVSATGVVAVINVESDGDDQQQDWTEDETLAILDGLRTFQGPDRYRQLVQRSSNPFRSRTISEIRVKARELRDSYLEAIGGASVLQTESARQEWAWLTSV